MHAQATFNMDLLEKNDHLPAVDLQRFNQQAGQPPGAYPGELAGQRRHAGRP
ncbi:FimD/PapC N-terminal domain-containing protein [Klebsiella pneumoniae subsp. pneumoniae]|nr:FimD/PapC N-terminal domain-containing protein [Klebsiella pneumoniae subsp. pneumoniae]